MRELLERMMLYSAKMKIQTTSNLFGKAIYTVMVVLVCTSAQAQNLFVSCGVGSLEYPVTTGSVIFEFTPGGAQISFASGFFASGLNAPEGLAFNSAGDLFEADFGSGNINEFKPDGEQSTFASGLNRPTALAFNSAGDLFEADNATHVIYEFAPDGARTTFATFSNQNDPSGLAFQPVPEPSTLALLSLAGAVAAVWRGRRHSEQG